MNPVRSLARDLVVSPGDLGGATSNGMKKLVIIAVIFFIALAGVVFVYKKSDNGIIKEPIPSPRVYQSPASLPILSPTPSEPQNRGSSTPTPSGVGTTLSEINLAVPFTIQAPHQNWNDPYGEFCEEASVLMAVSYVMGWTIPDADFADKKMMEIKVFEEGRFGYHKDTTAEETAIIIREFYNYDKVKLLENPTVEDIKKAVADGKAVIIPAAGRELGNPNFRAPGPIYHMLVVKGYTRDGNFITNDPGTRRGADYIYSPDVLMNSIHDWNGGDVLNGKRVVIVVG